MIKTDTLWKGSFFAIGLAGLYFAWKKPTSPQVIEAAANSVLPSPAQVNFGGYQGPNNPAGNIDIGGSPVYLTYNYPPATNPVVGSGTTAAQGLSATPPPPVANPVAPKRRQSNCGGGCRGRGNCDDVQVTPYGAASASVYSPNDLSNILSLLSK